MSKSTQETQCVWESRELGSDEQYIKVASEDQSLQLDNALGLKTIAIRLPINMIEAYKLIATHHGVGYQPLMRDILQRWVKEGLREVMAAQEKRSDEAEKRVSELSTKESPSGQESVQHRKIA